MIDVTRLDGRVFTLNSDHIEVIECNPDTFIRLTNGNSYLVRENRAEVVKRIIAYRRQIFSDLRSLAEAEVGIVRHIPT
jgi:flagellar protein FlbD